jgi:hypothetical protein
MRAEILKAGNFKELIIQFTNGTIAPKEQMSVRE